MDIRQFALNLIESNPNIKNNPQFKEMIDAIRNNDSVKGEQLANNVLSSMGMRKEDALQAASKFFGLH